MINNIKISDLDGILTISQKGGDSLLSVGEFAQEQFDTLASYKQDKRFKLSNKKIQNTRALFPRNERTLLKNVKPYMFGDVSLKTIKEVTGKVPVRTSKHTIPPQLTVEETVACTVAEWAYSSFGTLKGVSFLLSLQHDKIFKKF